MSLLFAFEARGFVIHIHIDVVGSVLLLQARIIRHGRCLDRMIRRVEVNGCSLVRTDGGSCGRRLLDGEVHAMRALLLRGDGRLLRWRRRSIRARIDVTDRQVKRCRRIECIESMITAKQLIHLSIEGGDSRGRGGGSGIGDWSSGQIGEIDGI